MTGIFTVHLAGPPILGGLRQDCARCGHVLDDWTGREVMAVAGPAGDAPTIPSWPAGARVARLDGTTYVVGPEGRPLTDDERECRPVS